MTAKSLMAAKKMNYNLTEWVTQRGGP